jgi:hypothetical protein
MPIASVVSSKPREKKRNRITEVINLEESEK